jgi:hypothetical protein
MGTLSNLGKVVVVGVIAAILIVFVIVYNGTSGSNQNTALDNSGLVVAANTSGTITTSQNNINRNEAAISPAPPNIKLITPVAGDVWKIGTQNPISWNTPGEISGDIYLVDAKTNAFVGVILPEVGPNQTAYSWNTRDVLLDRTDPLKKDVIPGTYIIKIVFDRNNIPVITSPKFTITN